MLLAVNPLRQLGLYTTHSLDAYSEESLGLRSAELPPLPPHVYRTSARAYRGMFLDKYSPDQREDQAILVNGESGAGKTESTKHCLHYLAVVSSHTATSLGHSSESSSIENQLIAANPITESLGNAHTSRNHNSSRFGKFINLHYCVDGVIISASLRTYLLETVRVVSQSKGERNFHVFYEMLAGMPEEDLLRIGLLRAPAQHSGDNACVSECESECGSGVGSDASVEVDFRYMPPTTFDDSESKLKQHELDADNFSLFHEALHALHFSEEDQRSLLDIVAAVLHLGNISFVESDVAGEESALFSSESLNIHVPFVCSALCISEEALLVAVARRGFTVNGVTTTKTLNVRAAAQTTDTFARNLYAHLFSLVLTSINQRLAMTMTDVDAWNRPDVASTISLLDIFGFEFFETNSFEQLCINYANEKLQDHFNDSVFRMEQELYAVEGLEWTPIDYPDNSARLDLLENRRQGIFQLCNERMKLKSAVSHETLAKDFYSACADHVYFDATPAHQRNFQFVVHHYAGAVVYNTSAFLEKNRSEVAPEFMTCLLSSNNSLVRQLVSDGEISGGSAQKGSEPLSPALHMKTPVMRTPGLKTPGNTPLKTPLITPLKPTGQDSQLRIKVDSVSFTTPPLHQDSDHASKRRLFLGSASRSGEGSSSPMRISSPMGSATRGSQKQPNSPKVISLGRQRGKSTTVLAQFSQQLRDLMMSIKGSRSHFIRCIKPNSEMLPYKFDKSMVLSQLRCGGVLSAIEVFRAGFPNRFEFSAFVHKYSGLVYAPGANPLTHDFHELRKNAKKTFSDSIWSETCRILFKIVPMTEHMLTLVETNKNRSSLSLEAVLAAAEAASNATTLLLQRGMCLGKTRVFLRAEVYDYLEQLLHRTQSFVVKMVQRSFRLSHMIRAVYDVNDSRSQKRLTQIGVAVDHFTGRTRASVITYLKAAIVLQRRIRVLILTKRLQYFRFMSTWLSSHYRGYKCRVKLFEEKVAKATRIQAYVRGRWQRKSYCRQRTASRFLQRWYRHVVSVRTCKSELHRIKRASGMLSKFKAISRGRSVRRKYSIKLSELEDSRKQHLAEQQRKRDLIMTTLLTNILASDDMVTLLGENLELLDYSTFRNALVADSHHDDTIRSKAIREDTSGSRVELGSSGVAMNPMHAATEPCVGTTDEEKLRAQVSNLEDQVAELQAELARQRGKSKLFGCCC